MGITVSLEVEVGYASVDIDLGDVDTECLRDELINRGHNPPEGDIEEKITEMFWAFKQGQTDRAMQLAIKIAENHTGRIL